MKEHELRVDIINVIALRISRTVWTCELYGTMGRGNGALRD